MINEWDTVEVKGYIENLNNVIKIGTTDNINVRFILLYRKIISCAYLYRRLSWKHFSRTSLKILLFPMYCKSLLIPLSLSLICDTQENFLSKISILTQS